MSVSLFSNASIFDTSSTHLAQNSAINGAQNPSQSIAFVAGKLMRRAVDHLFGSKTQRSESLPKQWTKEPLLNQSGEKVTRFIERKSVTAPSISVSKPLKTHSINLNGRPNSVVASPDSSRVYAGSFGLYTINTSTYNTSFTDLGGVVSTVAVTPDGKHLIASMGFNTSTYILDAKTLKIVTTVDVGISGSNIAIAPDGKKAFITGASRVGVVDLDSLKVKAIIPEGFFELTFSGSGKRACGVLPPWQGIGILNVENNTFEKIPVQNGTPGALSVHPHKDICYAAYQHGDAFSAIDMRTGKVNTFSLNGSRVGDMALTPDGKQLYMTDSFNNSVVIMDTHTYGFEKIPVGGSPFSVVITSDGDRAFVANYLDLSVSEISIKTRNITNTIGSIFDPSKLVLTPDNKQVYAVDDQGCTAIEIG